MKLKIKKMVILVLIFWGLLIVYVVTMNTNQQMSKSETIKNSSIASIFAISAEDIKTIIWTNEMENLGITRDDDSWLITNDSGLRAKKDLCDEITVYFSEITPLRVIGYGGSLESYGLDEPQYKIKAITKNDQEIELMVGNKLPSGDYYICDADKSVYVVSNDIFAICNLSLVDIAVKEYVPQVLSKKKIEISVSGTNLTAENLGVLDEYTCSSHYTWYTEYGENKLPLDTIRIEELVSKVTHIEFISIASTSKDYAMNELCMNNPDIYFMLEGMDKSYKLLFKAADGGYYFCMFENSSIVYIVDDSVPVALKAASVYEGLRPEDPYSLDWSSVVSVEMRYNGEKKLITKDIESDALDELRSYLEKIASSGQWDESGIYNDEIIGFTFYRDSKFFSKVDLSFMSYNENLSLVSFNGETRQLVSIYAVDGVIQLASKL